MKDSIRNAIMASGAVQAIPQSIRNNLFLAFPMLYRFPLISYESHMDRRGLEDIYEGLDGVKDLEGNIIECGSSRCGTSVLMAKHLETQNVHRKIFACDTFAGFDSRELGEDHMKGLTSAGENSFSQNSYEYVTAKIHRLGYHASIIPVKGLFQDTLQRVISEPFCFALIDCDLSRSVAYSASKVFPKLAKGGTMLFDDYFDTGFRGVRKAVDDFVVENRGDIEVHRPLRRLYYVGKSRK